jgi:hypothetical protein
MKEGRVMVIEGVKTLIDEIVSRKKLSSLDSRSSYHAHHLRFEWTRQVGDKSNFSFRGTREDNDKDKFDKDKFVNDKF